MAFKPKITVKVTDNSVVEPEIASVNGLFFFTPIISDKGKENVIQTITSEAQFIKEYGTLNFKKHKQYGYNALNVVKNGGVAQVLRVLPSRANEYEVQELDDFGIFRLKNDEGFQLVASELVVPEDAKIQLKFTVESAVINIKLQHIGNGKYVELKTGDFKDTYIDGIKKGNITTPGNAVDEPTILTSNDLTLYLKVLDSAKLANIFLDVRTKINDGKVEYKPVWVSHPDLESQKDFEKALLSGTGFETEAGWTSHILMGFSAFGRGNDENKIGIEFSGPIPSYYSKYSDFILYNLKFYRTMGLEKIYFNDEYTVSLHPDSKDDNNNSLFIEDILRDYCNFIKFGYNEDILTNLVNDINAGLGDKKVSIEDLEILTLQATTRAGHANYESVLEDGTLVPHVANSLNANLKNGNNGSLATITGAAYDKLVEDLMQDVFEGKITTDIYDAKRYPIDIILDANASLPVKEKMQEFILFPTRSETILALDTGLDNSDSYMEARNFVNNNFASFKDKSSFNTWFFTHYNEIKDQFTGKMIKVTAPYHLAEVLNKNYHAGALQRSIARVGVNTITNELVFPDTLSFLANQTSGGTLNDDRINYMIEDLDGLRFASQLTSQTRDSALSEIPNVIVLNRFIKDCRRVAEFAQFDNSPTSVADLNVNLNRLANDRYTSLGIIERAELTTFQSDYDRMHRRVKVIGSLKFFDFIYEINFEFVVNA